MGVTLLDIVGGSGRNCLCICRSGYKLKRCCGQREVVLNEICSHGDHIIAFASVVGDNRIEDGDPHDCRQALQLVIDSLHDGADAGDMRAVRCIALLAGVAISLGELEESVARVPGGRGAEIIRRMRPKTFDGVLQMSDLGYREIR
jgi:hypothetical protein